ncbi:hypothetical protein J2X68_006389 [Streptomyces sp. 3330]|uniref:hypothetical protein n=1 Tax=Streptomyces sp. 3330 TaxID=2817755 RepID=UPI00285C113B|nr:hypothetical protein [Streptomyces sp. 3330]
MYRIEFRERVDGSGHRVTELLHAGRVLGHPYTESPATVPGYRYLPVFFLANAVCLRWSPTLQRLSPGALLPDDPVGADGESAELAAAALAHVFAVDRLNTDVENLLDPDLVTAATRLTAPAAPHLGTADWEYALGTGLRAWRQLYGGSGGVVVASVERRHLYVGE